jgi:hypothetical protein
MMNGESWIGGRVADLLIQYNSTALDKDLKLSIEVGKSLNRRTETVRSGYVHRRYSKFSRIT